MTGNQGLQFTHLFEEHSWKHYFIKNYNFRGLIVCPSLKLFIYFSAFLKSSFYFQGVK